MIEMDEELVALRRRVAELEGELAAREAGEAAGQPRAISDRAQHILDVAGVILLVVGVDQRVEYINRRGCEILGYTQAEIVGANWFDRFVPAMQREPIRAGFMRQVGAQEAGLAAPLVRHEDRPVLTRTGAVRLIDWQTATLRDEQGSITGILSSGEDVTERVRSEQALRESEARYRELYRLLRLMADNVPDLIWAKDLDQRYVFANQAMCDKLLMAGDCNEPLGKTDLFFAQREREAHPENAEWHTFGEICANTDLVVMESRRPQRFDEYGNVRGEFLFLDVYKAPFWNEAGEMIGTVGCGRIVTRERAIEAERGRVQAQLQASLAEKEVLLREVHHRVKNNLQVISSLLKLQARAVVDEPVVAMLEDCQGRVRSMALVHETLHRSADLAQVDLLAYFRSLGSHVFQMYRQRGQAIGFRVAGEALSVSLDAAVPCGLIVNELLSNALKYAFAGRESGQVWVLLGRDGEAITLTVADDGVGLPAGLDIRTADTLGLQLVVTLVEQLRGTIVLELQSPVGVEGGGTSFRLRFEDPQAAKG